MYQVENIRTKAAFILPFFLFAGVFKSSRFSISTWYADYTFWIVAGLVLFKTIVDYPKKTKIRMYSPLLLIIMPLALLICINLLFLDFDDNTAKKIKNFIMLTCSTVMIFTWFIRNIEDLRNVNNALVIIGVLISFYIAINPIQEMWDHFNYLDAGTITAAAGIISFQRFFYSRKRIKLLYFSTFSINSLGVFFSYARGQQVFYAFVIALTLIKFLFFTKNRPKKKAMVLVSVIIVILIGFSIYQVQMTKNIDYLERFKIFFQAGGSEIRIELFNKAWDMFKENPFLGSGLGQYRIKTEKYVYVYPHNMPLEFAAELGIFGIGFYFSLISLSCWGYFRFFSQKIIREHLLIFFFIFLLSLKQGGVFDFKAFWAWSSIGIIMIGWKKTEKKFQSGVDKLNLSGQLTQNKFL